MPRANDMLPKKPSTAQRLAALERQVVALADAAMGDGAGARREARTDAVSDNAAHIPPEDRFWALKGLQARTSEQGEVVFAGSVVLPDERRLIWQGGLSTRDALGFDWADLSDALTALAHPVRLRILKRLFEGDASTQDLLGIEGMGTTGQLFHHLKALQQTGWLRSSQRGVYAVSAERIVPLLVVLAAVRG